MLDELTVTASASFKGDIVVTTVAGVAVVIASVVVPSFMKSSMHDAIVVNSKISEH